MSSSKKPEDLGNVGPGQAKSIDEVSGLVKTLEKRVIQAEKFYSELNMPPPIPKEKPSRREAAAAKRMRDLMYKFATIIRRISEHDLAWPFLFPVDFEGLGLDDYLQVIEKPMDLGTVQRKMKANDYKNVREVYADVRLVFDNAIKYNPETDDAHKMAQTMLEVFEEKWLQLLPKVVEEEKRQAAEEANAQEEMELEGEFYASMVHDLSSEFTEIDEYLKDLRKSTVCKMRKFSLDDKRRLSAALAKLSPYDLSKALNMVARDHPEFQQIAQEEVDLDLDTLSDDTLWSLNVFVKDALKFKRPPDPRVTAKVPQGNPGKKSAKTASIKTKRISDM